MFWVEVVWRHYHPKPIDACAPPWACGKEPAVSHEDEMTERAKTWADGFESRHPGGLKAAKWVDDHYNAPAQDKKIKGLVNYCIHGKIVFANQPIEMPASWWASLPQPLVAGRSMADPNTAIIEDARKESPKEPSHAR